MTELGIMAVAFGLLTLLSPASAFLWNDLFDGVVSVVLLTVSTVVVSVNLFFFTLYLYLGYFPLRAVLVGIVLFALVSTLPFVPLKMEG